MFKVNESEKEYRFGDSGPKYLMRGPRTGCGIVVLNPGQEFKGHYHTVMEENFFMMEGELEFHINGTPILCKVGDLLHLEPEESHYLINKSDKPAKAMFILAPYTENDKVEVE